MTELFGTDGIRGLAFEPPLDEGTVRRVAAALAEILDQRRPHVLLAGDTRASTEVLAGWFASSFEAAGGSITWGEVLPTPAVSHLLRGGGYDAGVVISASHNPAHDNGLKVLGPTGEKLADDTERRLETLVATARPNIGSGLPPPDRALAERYLELLAGSHERGRPLAGLRIVVDAANGAASALAGVALDRLGARVTAVGCSPDGDNINAACGATAPQRLVDEVLAAGADGGLALDGDADRAILVDEAGRVLDGDDIMLAWARALARARRLPGRRVVATVMSNFALERALRDDGLEMIRCAVGDRWVWQAMLEHGAALGGEQSGHVICSHHGVTGDGLLTGSHVLAIAVASGCPVSSLSNLARMPQVLLNVPVLRKQPFEALPTVRRQLAGAQQRLSGRGRVVLRYSGTEPLARVMVEGEDAAEIETLAEQLAHAIRADLRSPSS
jgi:phosphoglucosamine mutase